MRRVACNIQWRCSILPTSGRQSVLQQCGIGGVSLGHITYIARAIDCCWTQQDIDHLTIAILACHKQRCGSVVQCRIGVGLVDQQMFGNCQLVLLSCYKQRRCSILLEIDQSTNQPTNQPTKRSLCIRTNCVALMLGS
jgi:hypothetical protein